MPDRRGARAVEAALQAVAVLAVPARKGAEDEPQVVRAHLNLLRSEVEDAPRGEPRRHVPLELSHLARREVDDRGVVRVVAGDAHEPVAARRGECLIVSNKRARYAEARGDRRRPGAAGAPLVCCARAWRAPPSGRCSARAC